VSPYAPQTYVSTNSTTRARVVVGIAQRLFGVAGGGVVGAGAGRAGATGVPPPGGGVPPGSVCGAVDAARFAASETMLFDWVMPRVVSRASDSEVTKNSTPSTTVARVMKSVAPRPPNTVCVAPPNAPPARPPPFPDWTRITATRHRQTSR